MSDLIFVLNIFEVMLKKIFLSLCLKYNLMKRLKSYDVSKKVTFNVCVEECMTCLWIIKHEYGFFWLLNLKFIENEVEIQFIRKKLPKSYVQVNRVLNKKKRRLWKILKTKHLKFFEIRHQLPCEISFIIFFIQHRLRDINTNLKVIVFIFALYFRNKINWKFSVCSIENSTKR